MAIAPRRNFMRTLGAGAAASSILRGATAKQPSIIFFLSGDVGIDVIGCYGSGRYKTPNADALAKGGIRFAICYSAPLRGPTRCQFNTGRYAFRPGGITQVRG